ncbi:nucleotidyltransferase domain-containing protein [Anaerosporobacter faecicola]|uniref:nucleotidyltransferase domain-containing protein n=1 Tax=Anaerosporobacter faecicola TaxID=2718714 RepID=UPI00143AD0B9|nr:hypothetical protein [Anaerosporobacter faecicola]
MNQLVQEVVELLEEQEFEYAVCGGQAIDLFLGYESRKHGDIDILAYWKDRNNIITYMNSRGFQVYEMLGGGYAHKITDIKEQYLVKRNIFCCTDDCELVHLMPTEKKDIYGIEFDHVGETKLNFVEFLFNDKEEGNFLYARNKEIKRELGKAILWDKKVPYLAPEMLLLYKSTDPNREGYQQDYDLAYGKMDQEQKAWLNNALTILYPQGHIWL